MKIRTWISWALASSTLACGASAPGPNADEPIEQRDAQLDANGRVVRVRASADVAHGVGAYMGIAVNGKLIATRTVAGRTPANFDVEVPGGVSPGSTIDVVFSNDVAGDGQDRNLFVHSVSVLGHSISPAPTTAVYDLGDSYALATDGHDLRTAGSAMPWNGALRFTIPGGAAPAPVTPATIDGVPSKNDLSGLPIVGPIVATSGMRIVGKHVVNNAGGACIVVPKGVRDVVIEGNEIGPCAYNGSSETSAAIVVNGSDVTMRRNVIHDASSGAYATGAQHPILFEKNRVYNVLGPMPRGQMIQFNTVTGDGASRVSCNVSDKMEATRQTHYEDHINIYRTNRVTVSYNKLRGGDSFSGSGVVVGDDGGDGMLVDGNVIVVPANVGIATAGGSGHVVRNNRVYAVGENRSSRTSLGYGAQAFTASSNVVFENNRGIARGWIDWTGPGAPSEMGPGDIGLGFYTDGKVGDLRLIGNDWRDFSLSAAIFDEPLAACR